MVGDGSYVTHQPLRYTTASEENSAAVRGAAEAFGCRVTRYEGVGKWHQLVISGNGNRWLKLKLVGTHSNRSGIGARVRVVAGSHAQTDEVRSGGSYLSQSDLRLHFGMGPAPKADLVEVRWPSGQVDTLKDVETNQTIRVKEGAGLRYER